MELLLATCFVVFLVIFFLGSLAGLNNHNRYQMTKEIENNARARRYRNNISWRAVLRHLQPTPQGQDHTPWDAN